jgi:pilus assembly protein Flp/PilA
MALIVNFIEAWATGIALRLAEDRRGLTAMEYALIAALVAGMVVIGVALLGTGTTEVYSTGVNTT